MTLSIPPHDEETLAVVGIGFGPSNLALAVALREQAEVDEERIVTSRFIEQQPRFGWHRGMLIEGATLQVSFLKDLVTLRNPVSRYSFVSYLSAQNRLVDFINGKTFYPTRIEFHDYFSWVAEAMDDLVSYCTRAINVDPVYSGDEIVHWEVNTIDVGGTGGESVVRARNLVLGAGLTPLLPPGVTESEVIWHSNEFLNRVAELNPNRPYRFAVVGAGQSAAEVAGYLHEHFRKATVYGIFRRYGYTVAEETPFANAIFDPEAVDRFFGATKQVKSQLLRYHRNTNYSVVGSDLIAELYRRAYAEKASGARRLCLRNVSSVTRVIERRDEIEIEVTDLATSESEWLTVDQLIYATGYQPADVRSLLGSASDVCQFDEFGQVVVGRDYQVALQDGRGASGIFLQGGTEHTHGISSSLLSNIAVRAGEILTAVNSRVRELARS
jgi:L-ornithine N5-oxygenase